MPPKGLAPPRPAHGAEEPPPLHTTQQSRQTKVVLCQPDGSRNVGAVCRAMASMGYTQLAIVARPKEFFCAAEIRAAALCSVQLFDCAEFAPDLAPVLRDCNLVVGFTRRRGARRKYFSLTPEQLCQQLPHSPGNIALLFGNERVGLCDQELRHANLACHIPTHPQQPSLNLSHAVQIVLYELSKHSQQDTGWKPLNQQQLEQLSGQLNRDLCAIGLTDRLGNQRTELFLRDILSRAALSAGEGHRLLRMFETLRHCKTHKS